MKTNAELSPPTPSATHRLPSPLGGFMLALVFATALALSPAGRKVSTTLGFDFAESHGLTRLSPGALSLAFSRTVELPRIEHATTLSQMLTLVGYHLDNVRTGSAEVPRLSLAGLPGDLKDLDSPESRKALFIKAMLPLVLQVNEEIANDRARVLDLRDRQTSGGALAVGDQAWLANLYAKYGVTLGNVAELLRRLDVVPVSVALGQAALESGWGTSRFAQQGNALFGQIGVSGAPETVMLKSEADGTLFRSFDSLTGAVRAYVQNLNTHNAYREFRAARASLRKKAGEGHPLEGLLLVGALTRYSERGADYLGDLRGLIRINKLQQFDKSRLAGVSSTADASAPASRLPNA